MDKWAEITKEAFRALVSSVSKTINVENFESANIYHYLEKGIRLKQVDIFSLEISKYYIEDINPYTETFEFF
jgi:hypothetical protein